MLPLWSLFILSLSVYKTSSFYLSTPARKRRSSTIPSHFLARQLPIGYINFIIFLFDFLPGGCVEPMRSDAFIHFVCNSRRVNILLGVLSFIPKYPQENVTPKILQDLEIETDLEIPAKRPDLEIYGIYHSGKLQNENKRKQKER